MQCPSVYQNLTSSDSTVRTMTWCNRSIWTCKQTFGVFSASIENLDHFIIREAPGLASQ